MPLDHTIAGQARGIQINNPFEMLTRVKETRYQNEQRDMERQFNERKLGDLRRQDESRRSVSDAYREAGGDMRKASTILRQRGFVAEADDVEKQWREGALAQFDFIDRQGKAARAAATDAAGLLASIAPPKTPRNAAGINTFDVVQEGKPGVTTTDFSAGSLSDDSDWVRANNAYKQVRQTIVDRFAQIDPELAKTVPEEYDPDLVEEFAQRGRTYEQTLAYEQSLIERARDLVKQARDDAEFEPKAYKLIAGWMMGKNNDKERAAAVAYGKQLYGLSDQAASYLLSRTPEQLKELHEGKENKHLQRVSEPMLVKTNGKWVESSMVAWDPETNTYLMGGMPVEVREMPKTVKGTGSDGAAADNKGFPIGVKSWLDGMFNEGRPRHEVRALYEISRAKLLNEHRNLDDAMVNKWFDSVYGPVRAGDEERTYDKDLKNYKAALVEYNKNQGRQPQAEPAPAPNVGAPPVAQGTPLSALANPGRPAGPAPRPQFQSQSQPFNPGLPTAAMPVRREPPQGPPPQQPPQRGPQPLPGPPPPPRAGMPPPAGLPPQMGGPGPSQRMPPGGPAPMPQQAPPPPPPQRRPEPEGFVPVEAVKDFPGLDPETMKMILAVPNGVTFELNVEDDNGKMQVVKYRRESAGFRPVTVRK